jgi:hypothetical protein
MLKWAASSSMADPLIKRGECGGIDGNGSFGVEFADRDS